MYIFFFFFQAEDGIRDTSVTGVQTCALPIYLRDLGWRVGLWSQGSGAARFNDTGCGLWAIKSVMALPSVSASSNTTSLTLRASGAISARQNNDDRKCRRRDDLSRLYPIL